MADPSYSQLDERVTELFSIARTDNQRVLESLDKHIESCIRMQRAQLIGLITLLLMTVGTLLSLYVLPPRQVTTITSTTTTIPPHK